MSAGASFPVCLLVASILLSPLVTPAQALHFLGGADMGKYCRSVFGADAEAGLEPQNAYGWICKDRNGQKLPLGVSVTQVCRLTHDNPTAVDVLRDFYNPYSWDCYGNATELGNVDFLGYCKHLGHKGFIVSGTKPRHGIHATSGNLS